MEQLLNQPAARFTRHREGMLLLDRLLEASPEHAVCSWQAPQTHPIFGPYDGFPTYVAIECMAQCVAVHAGAKSSLKGLGPPLGLLLGTRMFKAAKSHLDKDVEYRVTCRELLRDSQGLASFDCEMSSSDFTVASCRLAVYEYSPGTEPDEPIQAYD